MGYKSCIKLLEEIKDKGLTEESKKQIEKEIQKFNNKREENY